SNPFVSNTATNTASILLMEFAPVFVGCEGETGAQNNPRAVHTGASIKGKPTGAGLASAQHSCATW
ncbi:MAG: hypothetical protein M3416_20235, partial [Acidobacteriota bacterium]|nr:hypothetical protein [Acidobacteriota bacterium]